MGQSESQEFSTTPPGALKRPDFEAGHYFYSQDLITEQHYRLQRMWRHNCFPHDWGIRCGLWVVPAKTPERPWALMVCPGLAIDRCGIMVEVCRASSVDIRDFIWKAPKPPEGARSPQLGFVGLRFAEDLRNPIPVPQLGCDCEDTVYENSRIRDSFQIDILWTLTKPDEMEGPDLCQPQHAPCPPPPDSPYIFLAAVSLPKSEADLITQDHIDLSIRKQLFPTNVLQSQLIACCCGKPHTR